MTVWYKQGYETMCVWTQEKQTDIYMKASKPK